MCIFDLDGTLDLTDSKLSAEIIRMLNSGIVFVAATGRTNSYVKEVCKKHNIIPPRFIVGDNGGTVYDTANRTYIKRTMLSHDIRVKMISEYIRLGGKLEDVRYTDGENVYVAGTTDTKVYYENDDTIEYMQDQELLEAMIRKDSDITKITLAGNRKTMKKMVEFAEDNGIKCWTDIGSTKFPIRAKKYYRLDITAGESSKGEAVEFLSSYTGISNFNCIGNGPNDFSMFKFALDSGMPVIVVQNREHGEITEESEELVRKVNSYATKIGMLDKVSVEKYPINKSMWKIENGDTAEERRRAFARKLNAKQSVLIPKNLEIKNQVVRRTQHRGDR